VKRYVARPHHTRYAVTSPVTLSRYGVTIRGNVTSVYPS